MDEHYADSSKVALRGKPWADVGDEDDADACGEHATPPSRGSNGHGSGECTPCVWHWKPQGCLRGRECGYCHLGPQSELKTRKKERVATLRSTSTQSHTMGLEGLPLLCLPLLCFPLLCLARSNM